jgi:hypothetical protein
MLAYVQRAISMATNSTTQKRDAAADIEISSKSTGASELIVLKY